MLVNKTTARHRVEESGRTRRSGSGRRSSQGEFLLLCLRRDSRINYVARPTINLGGEDDCYGGERKVFLEWNDVKSLLLGNVWTAAKLLINEQWQAKSGGSRR